MHFSSPEALEQYAAQFSKQLQKGVVLILSGVMGAGKTTFVRGLVRGLGSDAAVSSPTYTYVHEYLSPKGLVVHIDAYRLESPEKLWQMGLEDYLETAFVVLIEWGEGLVLDGVLRLRFEVAPDGRYMYE